MSTFKISILAFLDAFITIQGLEAEYALRHCGSRKFSSTRGVLSSVTHSNVLLAQSYP